MSEINLPQGSYNAADLIAAIQQSNDAEHSAAIQALQATLTDRDATVASLTARVAELEAVAVGSTEQGNLLQAVLTRLAAVEAPRVGPGRVRVRRTSFVHVPRA